MHICCLLNSVIFLCQDLVHVEFPYLFLLLFYYYYYFYQGGGKKKSIYIPHSSMSKILIKH